MCSNHVTFFVGKTSVPAVHSSQPAVNPKLPALFQDLVVWDDYRGPQKTHLPKTQPAAKPTPVALLSPSFLGKGGWYPQNRQIINQWLQRIDHMNFSSPLNAVFDWDYTSIFGDTNFLCVYNIIDHLKLRITPAELAQSLPERIGKHEQFYNGLSIVDLKADIIAAYQVLWPMIQQGQYEQARQTPEFADFRCKILIHYEASLSLDNDFWHPEQVDHNHPQYYTWIAWFAHYTPTELQHLAVESFQRTHGKPITPTTLTTQTPGKTGMQTFTFKQGMAVRDEIIELMNCLKQRHIKLYIMTGAMEICAQALIENLKYPVETAHVFGTRLEVDAKGKLTGKRDPRFSTVWNSGKTTCITKHIGDSLPLFIAGDSSSDYPMLTSFAETRIRLIINCHRDGSITELYQQAKESSKYIPHNLLQGYDPQTGHLQPSQDSLQTISL